MVFQWLIGLVVGVSVGLSAKVALERNNLPSDGYVLAGLVGGLIGSAVGSIIAAALYYDGPAAMTIEFLAYDLVGAFLGAICTVALQSKLRKRS